METAYVQARYHQILFDEAFGNFARLLWRVTMSPQMGHYLDMVDNRKADPVKGTQPNENFAREVMELFSLGVGNYTEKDIKEAARAFTGWRLQQGRPVFREADHDRDQRVNENKVMTPALALRQLRAEGVTAADIRRRLGFG